MPFDSTLIFLNNLTQEYSEQGMEGSHLGA